MKNVDLRQLALLCNLFEHQSLTEAAHRSHMTPSAASQALTRLKEVLSDALYVRDAGGYQPTPYIESTLQDIRHIVQIWRDASDPSRVRDPSLWDGRVVLACYDAFGSASLASFYRQVKEQAPKLRLDMHAPANGARDLQDLRDGSVDLLCSHANPPTDARDLHLETVKLFELTHCCVGAGHELASAGFTLERYVQAQHALITQLRREDQPTSPIDQELMRRGLPARFSVYVNSWALCAEMIADGGFVATTSEPQAASLVRMRPGILMVPLPTGFPWPRAAVNLVWHQRTHSSPIHQWLRQRLREFLA